MYYLYVVIMVRILYCIKIGTLGSIAWREVWIGGKVWSAFGRYRCIAGWLHILGFGVGILHRKEDTRSIVYIPPEESDLFGISQFIGSPSRLCLVDYISKLSNTLSKFCHPLFKFNQIGIINGEHYTSNTKGSLN